MTPPLVELIGAIDHADFKDAMDLLRADARVVTAEDVELIVVAQSRPGVVRASVIEAARRRAPLAGIVALLGSWCEGETRTGRPWPGVRRLYWYEFPAWWRRQLALRAVGRCPDWARWLDCGLRIADCGSPRHSSANPAGGLIVLSTPRRETAMALADVLHAAGYATVWQPPGRPAALVRGAAAGIWDGGQLDDREAVELAAFCQMLARDGAPVVALLDFPRRDRCDMARAIGAAAVLGKPWLNADLFATMDDIVNERHKSRRSPLAA